MRGPRLRGGPDSSGGPEPQLLASECLPLPGHVASPDLPQSWNGSGLLSGEQDSGPQGSSCLDVVKDNYKGPCLDTARGGTPVLGYRQYETVLDKNDKLEEQMVALSTSFQTMKVHFLFTAKDL